MNAYVFAAGNGLRLRPLTDDIQKCMLPVKGKPMIEHWLDAIFASESFDKVYVNVHYKSSQVISWLKYYCAEKSRKVFVIDETMRLLGTAGTLFYHAELHEDFMSVYSDTYSEEIFRRLPRYCEVFSKDTVDMSAGIITFNKPDDKSTGNLTVNKYGIMSAFSEKQDKKGVAWTGVLFGRPDFFDYIEKGDTDLAYNVLPRLVGRTRVLDHVEAYDIGRGVEQYEHFKRSFNNNKI